MVAINSTGIGVDSAGNTYVAGLTSSTDFPNKNPFQSTYGGNRDALVVRIDSSGSALVYSTYLGGSGDEGNGSGMAVGSTGIVYLSGGTNSTHFPTKKPLQAVNAGSYDAFVAKIDTRAAITTSLSSALNPSTYGQAVTFSAVVSSSIGSPPDGETVTFMKGTTVLGTGSLSGGSASFSSSMLPVGTSDIKAVYGGDSTFIGSTSTAAKQVISKATTTTTLTSSQNPPNLGQSVTFTATVTPQFSGTVKGAVTFYDGTMVLKTISLNGGLAKFTTTAPLETTLK